MNGVNAATNGEINQGSVWSIGKCPNLGGEESW